METHEKGHNRLNDAIDKTQPYVFLSSLLYENHRGMISTLRDIRKRVYDFNYLRDNELMPVYVDECHYDLNQQGNHSTNYESVDRLFARIRESKLVVFLIVKTQRGEKNSGSPISENVSPVSFWEIEFFQALVTRKPIIVLAEEGLQLDNKIKDVYYFFRDLLNSEIPCFTKDEFPDVIKTILKTGHLQPEFEGCMVDVSRFLQEVDKQRSKPQKYASAYIDTALLSPFIESSQKFNYKEIATELEDYKSIPDFEKKLARLYVLYRGMLTIDYNLQENNQALETWNTFLDLWFDTASWYGLHGRIWSFSLPIANDAMVVRNRLNEIRTSEKRDLFPTGNIQLARASYSTFKLSKNPHELDKALSITGIDPMDKTYCYIRAHVYMEQRNFRAAINDFKLWESIVDYGVANYKYLPEQQLIDHKLASDSVLGWAYYFDGKKVKGLEMMRRAVDGISESPERIRALKRLASAFKSMGDEHSAVLEEEAKELAIKLKAWGQLNQLLNS